MEAVPRSGYTRSSARTSSPGGPGRPPTMSSPRQPSLLASRDLLVESAPVGMGIWDRALRFVWVNRELATINGAAPEAHVGKTVAELLPDVDHRAVMDAMRRVVETGETIVHEVSGRTPASNETRCWRVRYFPLRGAEAVEGLGATCEDVTAHKRAEDAAAAAERKQRHLNEVSTVLARSLDMAVTLQEVARLLVPHVADWFAIDLLGEDGNLTRAAVAHVDPAKVELAHELWRRVPPRRDDPNGPYAVAESRRPVHLPLIPETMVDQAGLPADILQIVKGLGLHSSMCIPLVSRDRALGAITLVAAESRREYGTDDVAFGVELAARIATAIDNAELVARVRQSEERYRSLIDATSQIVWTNTPDGRMTDAQPGWSRFTGQSSQEYEGFGWSAALHPEDREATLAKWSEAVRTGSTFLCSHRIRRHDGVYRHFEVRAVPVREADGRIREWVGVHSDVTERVEGERERAALLEATQRARRAAEAMAESILEESRATERALLELRAERDRAVAALEGRRG